MRDEDVVDVLAKWPDFVKVTEEERNRKYQICISCDLFNSETKKCTVCSCEMNLLTWSKAMGTCPKGKFHGQAL